MTSSSKMWLKILGVAGIAGLGYYGFTTYQKRKAIASISSAPAEKNKDNSRAAGSILPGIPDLNTAKSAYCGGCS